MAIELTDAAYKTALARGRERLSQPFATGVRYDEMDHALVISFNTGSSVSFDPRMVEFLKGLPESAFTNATVTPGGDGLIFLGKEDADTFAVSLPGLLATLDPTAIKSQAATKTSGTAAAGNKKTR